MQIVKYSLSLREVSQILEVTKVTFLPRSAERDRTVTYFTPPFLIPERYKTNVPIVSCVTVLKQ